MMNEPSIFDSFENDETARKKKRYLKMVRTSQITALILSVLLVVFSWPSPSLDSLDTGAFLVSLICLSFALLSFKWPFPFLLTYSIVSVLFLLAFAVFAIMFWENTMRTGPATEIILVNLIYLFFLLLIVRGTIAAKKYRKLSKQHKPKER